MRKGSTWLHCGHTGTALEHRQRRLSAASADLQYACAWPEAAALDQTTEDPVGVRGSLVLVGDAIELLGQIRWPIQYLASPVRIGHLERMAPARRLVLPVAPCIPARFGMPTYTDL
jgi:hypothetical protein